ncbi:MAG: hypothetical protein K0Q72_3867, partial [Armatimonadetes bacterium]|nr:hypothetical protein [Armatimonadota bacterium]
MKRSAAVFLAVLALMGSAFAAEPATGPFSDLPLSHGAYRSVSG